MTEQTSRKLSRRDAIKLLGAAAGAAALANLPAKWSKPELVSGVMPVHAQTSNLLSLLCEPDINYPRRAGDTQNMEAGVSVVLPTGLVALQYQLAISFVTGTAHITIPALASGDINTANDGTYTLPITVVADTYGINIYSEGYVTVTWSFVDPFVGSGTCQQVLSYILDGGD